MYLMIFIYKLQMWGKDANSNDLTYLAAPRPLANSFWLSTIKPSLDRAASPTLHVLFSMDSIR